VIIGLKNENHDLLLRSKTADEVTEMRLAVKIMTEQVARARDVNEHLVQSFKQAQEESLRLRQSNKIIEQTHAIYIKQFQEYSVKYRLDGSS